MLKNYYSILEISPNATKQEIRKAYITLAKKYHPDLNPDDVQSAKEKFQEILEAYNVLYNAKLRQEYDIILEQGKKNTDLYNQFINTVCSIQALSEIIASMKYLRHLKGKVTFTGTGTGASIGASIGYDTGGFLGAAIGAIIGGIVGNIGGRVVGNLIQNDELNQIKGELSQKLLTFIENTDDYTKLAYSEVILINWVPQNLQENSFLSIFLNNKNTLVGESQDIIVPKSIKRIEYFYENDPLFQIITDYIVEIKRSGSSYEKATFQNFAYKYIDRIKIENKVNEQNSFLKKLRNAQNKYTEFEEKIGSEIFKITTFFVILSLSFLIASFFFLFNSERFIIGLLLIIFSVTFFLILRKIRKTKKLVSEKILNELKKEVRQAQDDYDNIIKEIL